MVRAVGHQFITAGSELLFPITPRSVIAHVSKLLGLFKRGSRKD